MKLFSSSFSKSEDSGAVRMVPLFVVYVEVFFFFFFVMKNLKKAKKSLVIIIVIIVR